MHPGSCCYISSSADQAPLLSLYEVPSGKTVASDVWPLCRVLDSVAVRPLGQVLVNCWVVEELVDENAVWYLVMRPSAVVSVTVYPEVLLARAKLIEPPAGSACFKSRPKPS